MKLDQKTDSAAFFAKYQFTSGMTMPHPKFKDTMEFTGLESHYVQGLEREVAHLTEYIHTLMRKIEWMTDREFNLWRSTKKERE